MQKARKRAGSQSPRLYYLQLFISVFAALILLRLFIISVGQHGYYLSQAQDQHKHEQTIAPVRGDILIADRYSAQPYHVATNVLKYTVYAEPPQVKDPELTANKLSEILQIDKNEVFSKISDSKKSYVVIVKPASDDQAKQISAAKLSGIGLEQESYRVYPAGDFLSQVLGFVGFKQNGVDKAGLYGLEKYLEDDLAGKPGALQTEADSRGNWIAGSERNFTPQVDGNDVLLTIDRSIQFKAETVLRDAVTKHGADSGSVIVADPKTGAILAMANYPSFDPNQYNKVKDLSVYQNLATTENYEPGSTMKAITLASGLDAGVITPTTTFEDTGVVEIGGYKIQNSDLKGHGIQTMTDIIDKSLNTGAIFVEQKIGNENFAGYLKKFGFGAPTNIELPEGVGNLTNLKDPRIDINFYTSSFGQGITVTPIQMLQSYIALANGGKMMQPYIISEKMDDQGNVVQKTEPKMVRQVISDKASAFISAMLVDNVENGHGKRAGVKGYYIGGKTGTAQIVSNGKYVDSGNNGSFIGYGPVENPRFVMLVNVNRPRDVRYAETTAAPAFGEIASFILNYYEVPPTRK